jgi:hypothetical protein
VAVGAGELVLEQVQRVVLGRRGRARLYDRRVREGRHAASLRGLELGVPPQAPPRASPPRHRGVT